MFPTTIKKMKEENQSAIEFAFDNLTDEEFASEKEAMKFIKDECRKSNKESCYYPFKGYFFALDIDCDVLEGLEKGILIKSDAEKLMEISNKRDFGCDWEKIEIYLEDNFSCDFDTIGECTNCKNCK